MIREAIEILKTYTDGKDNTDKVEISVMQLNRIIKALEQQPTDAVDRVTIKEYLESFGKVTNVPTKENNNEQMEFPDNWEEFEEYYGFYDTEEVYTNNSRLIPSFRVKQWLEHQMTAESESRMSYVQETVNAILNTCDTDSIADKAMRNAAKFVQNAIDGSYPDFEELPKMGKCKDCKYFEYDSFAEVHGIPLIVAHEICNRWGDGCKTKEDGYCFLYEPKIQEVEE